jgi:hypothetical protein
MSDPKPIRERFPPPWPLEQVPGGYRLTDREGTAVAYVYAGPQGLTTAVCSVIVGSKASCEHRWKHRASSVG